MNQRTVILAVVFFFVGYLASFLCSSPTGFENGTHKQAVASSIELIGHTVYTLPSPAPSPIPTPRPTAAPTAISRARPSERSTARTTAPPTALSTARPSGPRTAVSIAKPSATAPASAVPADISTAKHIPAPTRAPTERPTESPKDGPTELPTELPTERPTERPPQPTERPTEEPTGEPVESPEGLESEGPESEGPVSEGSNGPGGVTDGGADVAGCFKLSSAEMRNDTFYSQYGQDKYLYENFFSRIENGTFVEMGAFDGIKITNTLFFESKMNWRGICIEPSYLFRSLERNRPKCINMNVAIGSENTKSTFINVRNHEVLNGIKEFMNEKHLKRLEKYELEETEIDIVTFERAMELAMFGSKFNYFSLDVEGAECEVLKSINFDVVQFDVLTVENDYFDSCAADILEPHGYRKYVRIRGDDLFVRNEFC